MPVLLEPLVGALVKIEIENVEIVNLAGPYADLTGARILTKQGVDRGRVRDRIVEAIPAGRLLVTTRKDLERSPL
jgi:hypothetical protein